MLGLIRTVALVLLTIVAAIFFVQNLATIEVAFLTWSFAAPRAIIFLLLFAIGLAMGYLLRAFRPRSAPRAAGAEAEKPHQQRSAP
jgi:uncharacterized integral membrane protein